MAEQVKPCRVVVYARVSTNDQNCALQIAECVRYIESQPGWVLADQYIDNGWSGAKTNRPQLDRLMRDAKNKKFNVVCVWRLDRFGRSLIHVVSTIEHLNELKIGFISVTQGINTCRGRSPEADLQLQIIASFAQFERALIRERVIAGLEVAKSRGVQLGRARGVYTSEELAAMREQGKVFEVGGRLAMARKNKPGQYLFLVNQDQVQEMKQKGLSLGAIAAQVGTSKSTVKRIIAGEAA